MPTFVEIDDVEICRTCGHQCHCDATFCKDCISDEHDDPSCEECIHG